MVPDDQAGLSNKRTADGEINSEIAMEKVENIDFCENEGKIFILYSRNNICLIYF